MGRGGVAGETSYTGACWGDNHVGEDGRATTPQPPQLTSRQHPAHGARAAERSAPTPAGTQPHTSSTARSSARNSGESSTLEWDSGSASRSATRPRATSRTCPVGGHRLRARRARSSARPATSACKQRQGHQTHRPHPPKSLSQARPPNTPLPTHTHPLPKPAPIVAHLCRAARVADNVHERRQRSRLQDGGALGRVPDVLGQLRHGGFAVVGDGGAQVPPRIPDPLQVKLRGRGTLGQGTGRQGQQGRGPGPAPGV